MEAINEGFMLIGTTEPTTESKDSVVVLQRESAEEPFQLLKTIVDVRRVAFVGFCVGLVQLIQDGSAITVTGVEGMSGYGHFANFLTTKQKEKPYWLLLLFLLQVFFGDGQH